MIAPASQASEKSRYPSIPLWTIKALKPEHLDDQQKREQRDTRSEKHSKLAYSALPVPHPDLPDTETRRPNSRPGGALIRCPSS